MNVILFIKMKKPVQRTKAIKCTGYRGEKYFLCILFFCLPYDPIEANYHYICSYTYPIMLLTSQTGNARDLQLLVHVVGSSMSCLMLAKVYYLKGVFCTKLRWTTVVFTLPVEGNKCFIASILRR